VAPLPGGLPVELGLMLRYAVDKDYERLLPTMERAGFIQPGEQVSAREIDDMLRQYVEPVQSEVFHYTRKWLQRMAAVNMDRSVAQIRTARQLDLPRNLALPLRVIASTVAISAQLDAHVPLRSIAEQFIPGFAQPSRPAAV
jgi:predicted unusual protein kinase regulating ubiquinone biosynthesis (AarF/ABC1/UbiB family)